MNRFIGITGAILIGLLLLVPIAAAAAPWDQDEHFLLNTGGDITLPADQRVDLLVVVDGTATIEGEAGAVFVVNGAANFVGATTQGIVAIRSDVTADAGSTVAGDVRTIDSTFTSAPGAVIDGTVRDVGPEMANAWAIVGVIGLVAYLAFAVTAIFAGLALAGLAARQVREAEALISHEPLPTIAAAFIGLIGITLAAVVAIVTVVGAPLGLGLLVFVLPGLLVIGHLVAGIWIGDQILARTSPGVVRERPYLAAVIGLVLLGVVGAIPFVGGIVGGLAVLVGFGAVVLLMWRVLRGTDRRTAPVSRQVGAPVAG